MNAFSPNNFNFKHPDKEALAVEILSTKTLCVFNWALRQTYPVADIYCNNGHFTCISEVLWWAAHWWRLLQWERWTWASQWGHVVAVWLTELQRLMSVDQHWTPPAVPLRSVRKWSGLCNTAVWFYNKQMSMGLYQRITDVVAQW